MLHSQQSKTAWEKRTLLFMVLERPSEPGASDSAHAPREVSEAALAHAIESKVEASYARTDHLESRRELMEQWAKFLCGGKK